MRPALPFVTLVAVVALVACGSAPPPPPAPPAAPVRAARPHRPGMAMSSELGQLDAAQVDATFQGLLPQLSACLERGARANELLSGHAKLFVRIGQDGRARWAYLVESTLGDRDTERCMLESARRASWPPPEGGEGQAQKAFDFDLAADARPPVAWEPARVRAALEAARPRLAACGPLAGATVTLYVGTDGAVTAAGVAPRDEKGEGAIDCAADVLRALKLDSPGSWPAKVTARLD